jgi:hypothetical protein
MTPIVIVRMFGTGMRQSEFRQGLLTLSRCMALKRGDCVATKTVE